MKKFSHNYWLKSGFFTVSQRLSLPFFGVLTFILLIRALSKEELGIWVMFLTITGIIEIARNGLFKAAFIKYHNSVSLEEQRLVKSNAFWMNFIFTLASFSLLIVLSPYLSQWFDSPALVSMFWLYGITAAFYIFFFHFDYILQAQMRFQVIFYAYFIKQAVLCLLIVVTILLHPALLSVKNLVLMQMTGVLVGTLIAGFNLKGQSRIFKSWDRSWASKLWDFGRYGFYTNISNSLLTNVDHLLLGGFLSTAYVAVYNAAIKIINIFIIPSVALADILYPKSIERQKEQGNEAVKRLYEKAVGATLLPMVPAAALVWIFTEPIILILAGDAYLESAPVLRVLIASILVLPFVKQFGTVMNALEMPQINFYFTLSLALVNLTLNFLLIKSFGLMGAAYATLSTYILGFIGSQFLLFRLAGISTLRIFKESIGFGWKLIKKIRSYA